MPIESLLFTIGLALSIGVAVFLVLSVPLAQAPSRGARGLARTQAREAGFFGPFEGLLRLLATHASHMPLDRQRRTFHRSLVGAGEMRGLTPDELIVISGISTVLGIAVSVFFFRTLEGTLIPIACLGAGPFLPIMQLQSMKKERYKAIDRGLPAAIDLASLCMGAGLDFPGALSHVVENMPNKKSPVRQELERILQELSLGRTRKQALQSMAGRVKTPAVREFVAAVVQAEEKGTPITEVLAIQASALRNRRSVLAEEAAARAGVLLMLPMLMMMGAIVLLLMGPLFIQMAQGGM